jgi:hypothetical protein
VCGETAPKAGLGGFTGRRRCGRIASIASTPPLHHLLHLVLQQLRTTQAAKVSTLRLPLRIIDDR